ncbi:aldo/keto reductase [Methanobacterium congolense]|uniref:Putative oxidoreductase YccK n=1 Tax=Methanobacterium congolense TaxID=118062 RepID=A0A1D3L4R0_9EURY|nr:aldo/keto reductase [Methanobacterium congolense]SCG86593.1 putative oxidoreductase YccK [Methanobacterium congolense]
MLYRELGSTGEKVSILGFGAMRLPTLDGQDAKIDFEKTKELVRYAVDCGVNYIDTAHPYHSGESERVLGEVLKDGYREKVHLATKLPSWKIQTREDMDFYLEEQMKRLQTDQIDFYLLHSLKKDYWENLSSLGVLEFLDDAVADGRIKYTGFSFHDEIDLFFEIIDSYNWDVCQVQYNLVDENYQAGIDGIRYASSQGIGVIVMEPMRGGALVNEVPREVQEIWDEAPVRRTPAEWALRFLWDKKCISTVLSGMNTFEQLEENLKIGEAGLPDSLTDDELDLVREVRRVYHQRMKVLCTECGYCMPCPDGVNIPGNFRYFNSAHMYGDVENARMNYYGLLTEKERASNCTQCGECEWICPQMIDIKGTLREVSKTFEK